MRRAAAILLVTSFVLASSAARADEMDVTLNRFTTGDPPSTDVAPYAALMSQLGVAISSPSLAPARTLGARHFYVGVENALTNIDENGTAGGVRYWALGTVGGAGADRTNGNALVNGFYDFSRLAFRKGLPFGVEIGASAGHAFDTRAFLWSAEVRVALLEGFRHRLPGYLPDVTLRGAVTTMTGESAIDLTVPLAEVIVSKGIRVGSDAVLSPMVSAQLVWITADSNVIRLVAPSGSSSFGVFPDVNDRRTRMSAGLHLRYRMLALAGSVRFDLVSPGAGGNLAPDEVSRQWNMDLGVGVVY